MSADEMSKKIKNLRFFKLKILHSVDDICIIIYIKSSTSDVIIFTSPSKSSIPILSVYAARLQITRYLKEEGNVQENQGYVGRLENSRRCTSAQRRHILLINL
jgi:hypothetical protein